MPTKDTDNPKFRRQQAVKKLTHVFRKHGLKAACALALSGGTWHVSHNYINADIHFLEAMDVQDTADMRYYAGNLVSKSDIDTVMERIAQEGRIEPLRIVFEEAEDHHMVTWNFGYEIMAGVKERLFDSVVSENADDYITAAIQNGHNEFLITFAEELGQRSLQDDIFVRLLNEAGGEAAADLIAHNEEFDFQDVARLLPDLKSSISNQAQLNNFLANYFDVILSGSSSPFERLGYGLSDSVRERATGMSPIVGASRKNNFFRDLLENGYEEAAQLILNGPHADEDLHSLYLQHIAANGDLERMIDAAINARITTDERLINFAVEAALASHYGVAERFIDHFELAEDQYRNTLFRAAVSLENQDAAHYALLTLIGLGQEGQALDLLESIAPEHPDLAYDLVASLHYMFHPRHRERLISMFEGTQDDNLRRVFEGDENAMPSVEEQARPQVSRPAYKLP